MTPINIKTVNTKTDFFNSKKSRGFTLIELMLSLAITTTFIGAITGFLIIQSRSQNTFYMRSVLINNAQASMSLLEREFNLAGFGIPRRLAIKSFTPSADVCSVSLTVASANPLRQWEVSSTSASTVTLSAALPYPAAMGDVIIPSGRWLFLYRNSTVGTTSLGDHGHGLVLTSSDRAIGSLSIAIDGTNNFSTTFQPKLDTSASSHFNATSIDSRAVAMMEASVSTFGVDCTDADHPYLYWDRAGSARIPVASTITALTFSFFIDADADGQTDDQNSDSKIDVNDLVAAPTDLSQVTAISASITIRSDNPDPATKAYRYQSI
ncbi:prepilin-type N-terminal cleavage/methylation domain-containing protein, partial [Myxococcota bacterium]|nr:prepilin-type N-terminal cleavage/methylation domain-containing protein [Myxococcota bacterium]